jgi:L,D-peptidoglycan transpeptidase YkuD (ErfK/YbiS/YcfS/YnhG family)
LIGLAALPLLAGAKTPPPTTPDPLAGTRQLVVVVPADWDAPQARLQAWRRDATGHWQPQGTAFDVSIGRAGSAWGLGLLPVPERAAGPRKHEGDGRSTAGVFAIGTAFGYAGRIDSAMPYRPRRKTATASTCRPRRSATRWWMRTWSAPMR